MIDALKMLEAAGALEGTGLDVTTRGPTAAAVLDDTVSTEPITLQQAKDHLRVVVSDDDAYITGLIIAARQMAENRLNRTLVARTRFATFDTWGRGLTLPKPPLQSVVAVRYLDPDGEAQVLPTTDYVVNARAEPGQITATYNAAWPLTARQDGVIEVEYVAGYETIPQPIIQWMLLTIGTMYDNRESVAGGPTHALGDDFAKWLLQPYMVYE